MHVQQLGVWTAYKRSQCIKINIAICTTTIDHIFDSGKELELGPLACRLKLRVSLAEWSRDRAGIIISGQVRTGQHGGTSAR